MYTNFFLFLSYNFTTFAPAFAILNFETGTLYGITLITILRLGLVTSQREIAYHNFVALPLYEDMAPWNIVFQGSRMAYIDYDTKDVTFDTVSISSEGACIAYMESTVVDISIHPLSFKPVSLSLS